MCALELTVEPIVPVTVSVVNNFSGGYVKAAVNNSNPPSISASTGNVSGWTGNTVYIAPDEVNNTTSTYNWIFNDTEAPLNLSRWNKFNGDGSPAGDVSSASANFILSSTINGYKYEARMIKEYDFTLGLSSGSGNINGSLIVDNSTISVPTVVKKYEGNGTDMNLTVANTYIAGASGVYLNYTFNNWKINGVDNTTNASVTVQINAHKTVQAYYKSKPSNGYRNLNFTGNTGDNITISWSDHPSTSVTQYQIWRRVRHNGVTGAAELLGTVNHGTTSFTDQEYVYTSTYTDDLLYYDVRAYFQPDGTYADEDYVAVYGSFAIDPSKQNNNKSIGMQLSNIPQDYALSAYPNPFNPATVIRYSMPEAGAVTLKVYNILSQQVASLVDETKSSGIHTVNFNANNLPTGIYIARLQTGSKVISIKLQLMK